MAAKKKYGSQPVRMNIYISAEDFHDLDMLARIYGTSKNEVVSHALKAYINNDRKNIEIFEDAIQKSELVLSEARKKFELQSKEGINDAGEKENERL